MWLLSNLGFKSKEKKDWNEVTVVFAVCILAVVIRYWYIAGGTLVFSFDQARDAYLSRQIITEHDFKIQGPNASGTNDTIYHGVLYYYLIAPFYAFSGNPMHAALFQILLTSFGLVPSYFLIKSVTNSKTVALFTVAAAAVSINTIQAATWLSNPSIALFTVPFVYFATWKVFYQKSSQYLPWLALGLGCSLQSAIWFGYLFISVTIFACTTQRSITDFFALATKRQWLIAVLIFIISTATMLLTQFKLAQAGIFTFASLTSSLTHTSGVTFSISGAIEVLQLFIEKLSKSFFPAFPLLSVFIFFYTLWYWKKTLTTLRVILLIWLLGPFALLSFQAREAQHLFITTEIALYGLFAATFKENIQKYLKPSFLSLTLFLLWILLAFSQLQFARVEKKERLNDYTLQSGMFLQEELAAIDWTYAQAQGKPFTIATYTAPFGYNTLWAYLYDWYGKSKYGYVPSFYGGNQTGIFAGELLAQAQYPESIHFVFFEPFVGAPSEIKEHFEKEQSTVSTFSREQYFGTLRVIHAFAPTK